MSVRLSMPALYTFIRCPVSRPVPEVPQVPGFRQVLSGTKGAKGGKNTKGSQERPTQSNPVPSCFVSSLSFVGIVVETP